MPLVIFLAFALTPAVSHAEVRVSEIAWMGSVASANDEWIELYNTGTDTVILDGWTLTDGASFTIKLAGRISASSYAVLERTDDDSAPGKAFLIYTGALSNEGRTLTLRRTDGGVEDEVVGGKDWSDIGGDNRTKNTAQRIDDRWVTALATPGSATIARTNDTKITSSGSTTGVANEATRTATTATRITPMDDSNLNIVALLGLFTVVVSGIAGVYAKRIWK